MPYAILSETPTSDTARLCHGIRVFWLKLVHFILLSFFYGVVQWIIPHKWKLLLLDAFVYLAACNRLYFAQFFIVVWVRIGSAMNYTPVAPWLRNPHVTCGGRWTIRHSRYNSASEFLDAIFQLFDCVTPVDWVYSWLVVLFEIKLFITLQCDSFVNLCRHRAYA